MVSTDLDRSMKGSKRADQLYLGPTLGMAPAPQNILSVTTGGTTTIDRNITLVEVNFAGPVTIQLSTTVNVNPNLGTLVREPVTIVDISGAASTNNITIVPFGSELIIGLASIAIFTDYGSYTLGPLATGGWSLLDQNPSNIGQIIFETRSAVQVTMIPVLTTGIQTLGYGAAGDQGGAIYKKVVSEPTHPGKVQSADGAWWEITDATLNFRQFGAIASGDEAAELQDAIDSAIFLQRPLFITSGTFSIGSALSVTDALTLYGVNRNESKINLLSDSIDGIILNTQWGAQFYSFGMSGAFPAVGGSFITVTAPSLYHYAPVFRDLGFVGGYTCINILISANFVIDSCFFQAFTNIGVEVANDLVGDAGDSIISSCFFNQAVGSTGIYQRSGGGLKVMNNKIGGQGAFGYRLVLDAAVNTSELWIMGNSIEGHTSNCIDLVKGTSAGFASVQIVGNQIGGLRGIVQAESAALFCADMQIVGNTISVVGTTGFAILINGSSNFVISGNTFVDGGTSTTGIAIAGVATNGIIADNAFRGFTGSTEISNSVTGMVIHDNIGWNPQGVVGVTPTASPYTHTAGASPETLYIAASTSITALTQGGLSILPAVTAANENYTIGLGPNEAVVITYTGTLTAMKMVH